MVGMMTGGWADKAAGLLKLVRGSPDIPAKMERLRQLKELLLHRDPSLLPDFVPLLAELRRDQPSPVRRLLAECIGEIGLKHVELLPKIVPALISLLEDEAPAVVRQTIISGTSLFINTLEKVAIQGLSQSELDDSMESSWKSMLSFKDAVFPLAFQPGSDGIRLLAIKFVEALILLYTPDPSGSTDPPRENGDGSGFNISWLRGGHPLLKVGELSTVASQSLGILLDQLRCPQEKSLSNSIVIVLINSLSAIARKRPAFYGRILPVLLRLDPEISVIKGVQVSGAFHALKNAFVAFLKCTHPGAAPWRARLVVALKDMNAGNLVDQASLTDVIESDDAIKKEKLPLWACSDADGDVGRKRIKLEEVDDLSQDDDVSNKRARSTTVADEEAEESVHAPTDKDNNNVPSRVLGMDALDGSIGPVQQLVAVFAELVTQGDKASGSLDILISTISSDLLAEVVMANMSHLPPTFPKTEVEEDFVLNMASHPGLSWKDNSFIPPSSFVSDILSLSNSLSLLNAQRPTHLDTTIQLEKEERTNTSGDAALPSTYDDAYRSSVSGTDIPSFPVNVPGTETNSVFSSRVNDAVPLEDKIPGLGSIDHVDDVQESLDVSHSIAEEHQGSLEQVISSDSVLFETASSGSMPTHISESVGTRIASADSSEVPSTSSTFLPSQFLLPKMAAPVIDVTDEQKDNLQRVALERIIESHKQMAIAGFSNIRFSLLACLGVEFPSELDPWGLLQKHISLDYLNHEGHELTLHVLYRLFRESEQDQDFFSSTAAVSDYEKFLLAVAESLRDIFPASDKSLSKLLTEVPYLPKPVLKLLETLCSHDSKEKHDKDFQSGDRVTQGLSATWSLILQRPSNRDTCLKIALQSAVHHLEEVRMKAIRLVANKLFPMSCIAQKIEDFAGEMLRSVVDDFPVGEGMGAEGSIAGSLKDTDLERDQTSMVSNGISSDSLPTLNAPSTSLSEAQRRMALYFALCTKKHSLLQQIFIIYKSMPQAAKEAVHRHIPILVRTTGASADLLSIISDPPAGSEALLMQVLHTLTDGTVPSQELIISVRQLYDTKLKDVEVLIPILSYLSKDEVLAVFPQLVGLPLDKFHGVLSRILQGPPHTGISLTPEEVLIAIHGIDPEKDSISLKKVMDACTACFEQRQVFTQQVLAKVLNQLVEQIPLPLLFMRTVIQAIGAFPALVDFVMEILARLVNKQIWKYPKLWVGFLKCAVQTKPQSFNVLLQLPAAQLENALNRNPVLRSPIIEHASQPNIRSTLPRATLAVLGLVSDSQTTAPPQAIKSSAADASNSVAESGTENTQESTAVK